MSDPSKPVRTWEWIVFSCLTTLLSANSTILRPDPVTTSFKRVLLVVVLNVKTVLFPQHVLFEAVTEYVMAKTIRDRVNAAAELCHEASLTSNDVGPAVMGSPQTMWDKMKSWIFGKKIGSLRLVCETGDGYNQRLDFAKFTMAHGHFALMGGFTVGVPPTTDDGLPIHENSESQEVVSLRPQQLFALFEKEDPREARFDLFTQISEVQIKQLHEYSSTGHLVTIFGRLLMFVWYCYQRQHLGLETSPLEVLTVGHVFLTVVIEIFWWNKPPYLRLPIQNLDRQALCQAVPGLEQELEEVVATQGKKTVDAYMSFQNFRLAGQLLWPPTQFDKVGPKINASYRAVIVFGLSACHIAILLLPTWRVNLSDTEAWRKNLEYAFRICAGIAVLAALDTVVRHIWRKSPKFRKLYDGIEDATPVNGTTGGAASYAIYTISLILSLGPNARTNILICLYAAAVAMAVSEVYQASEGVYAVGPGDVPKFDLNIFGAE